MLFDNVECAAFIERTMHSPSSSLSRFISPTALTECDAILFKGAPLYKDHRFVDFSMRLVSILDERSTDVIY